MSEILQSRSRSVAHLLTRRVAARAAALLAFIIPLAVLGSYSLSRIAGARHPEAAGALTFALCGIGGVCVLWALARRHSYPHDRLGLCNIVTLTRGVGIAMMAGLLTVPVERLGWGLVLLAGLLLALDGIDGWAARRAKLQSRFGARLDVETDVAFALTLAALAIALGQAGIWFLALGFLRPLYLGAGHLWPVLRAPLPDAAWRKRMAALQMGVQVAILAPVIPSYVANSVAALLLCAMIASFAVDIRSQLHRTTIA